MHCGMNNKGIRHRANHTSYPFVKFLYNKITLTSNSTADPSKRFNANNRLSFHTF